MATIKSHSDLDQSRKLATILPLESADMCWTPFDEKWDAYLGAPNPDAIKKEIPCWSLAALISIIPQELFDGEYIINITEGCDNRWILTYDNYKNENHSYYGLSSGANNLVDACYKLVLKLHEHKML